jgi:hypothetical protein
VSQPEETEHLVIRVPAAAADATADQQPDEEQADGMD